MIVDCHVHIPSPGETWEWAPFTPDLDACVRYLRKCRVEKAVASSVRAVTAKTAKDVRRGNDEVFEAAENYGGFFIPASIASPECPGAGSHSPQRAQRPQRGEKKIFNSLGQFLCALRVLRGDFRASAG